MNGPNNSIGYCDFTANPVSGKCLHNCPDCYAERIRVRYAKPAEIKYHPDWLNAGQIRTFIKKNNRPPKIFLGSMHDLFGDWIDNGAIQDTIDRCKDHPEVIFQFLTQNPKRYQEFTWPDNCWIGTTCRTHAEAEDRIPLLIQAKAKIRFVSFEPLLENVKPIYTLSYFMPDLIHWCIVGCKTPYHKGFLAQWAKDIIEQCRIAKVPVWVKQLPNADGKAIKDMNEFPIWARRREFPK